MSIAAGDSAVCPHCRTGVRFESVKLTGGASTMPGDRADVMAPSGKRLELLCTACPVCGKPIVGALRLLNGDGTMQRINRILWPAASDRPVPPEVEADDASVAADFREAVDVLPASSKASAALSRRCLQAVLTRKAGVKSRDLADQIDEVIKVLPSAIADNVDAVRQVGNFAAHPSKSKSTGEIVEVEPGEAEWLLEVLEELFEHYYVAPARAASRRAALNTKLSEIGKPPLKTR